MMMFVQSLNGISHNKIEDTREEHLELADSCSRRSGDKGDKFHREERREITMTKTSEGDRGGEP